MKGSSFLKNYRTLDLSYSGTMLTFFSQSQAQLPSTIHFQSSSTLGTGKVTTHQDARDKLEDKEVRRALEGRSGKRKRQDGNYDVVEADSEDEDDFDGDSEVAEPVISKPIVPSQPVVGGALARNTDGTVIAPKIRQKSKNKKV